MSKSRAQATRGGSQSKHSNNYTMKNILFLFLAIPVFMFAQGNEGTLAKWATDSTLEETGLQYDGTLGVNGAPTTAELTTYARQKPSRVLNVVPQQQFVDSTGWEVGTGWSIGGTATAAAASGDLIYTGGLTLTAGNAYEVSYTFTWTTGYIQIKVGNAIYTPFSGNHTSTILLFPTDTTGGFRLDPSGTFTGSFDNLTIHEIKDPATVLFSVVSPFFGGGPFGEIRVPTSHGYFIGGGGKYNTQGLNTSIGMESMMNCTTCSDNVALGYQALRNNTIGQANTAVGWDVLYQNTIGNYNTGVGSGVLASSIIGAANTGMGYDALRFSLSASNNAGFGYEALGRTSIGANNAALGYRAGKLIASGGNNTNPINSTFLGYDTRASAVGVSNETVVGYQAKGKGPNTVTLGNTSTTAVYLAGTVGWFQGYGAPEGVVTAPPGSLYTKTSGSGAALYVKQTGTGNTGWIAK
jgi:hypothetical protein